MIIIKNIESRVSNSGEEFLTITFQEPTIVGGVINIAPKICKRNFWKDKFPYLFDLNRTEEHEIHGEIITRRVKPYTIGRTVRSIYTTAVLGVFSTPEELDIGIEATFKKLQKDIIKSVSTTKLDVSSIV